MVAPCQGADQKLLQTVRSVLGNLEIHAHVLYGDDRLLPGFASACFPPLFLHRDLLALSRSLCRLPGQAVFIRSLRFLPLTAQMMHSLPLLSSKSPSSPAQGLLYQHNQKGRQTYRHHNANHQKGLLHRAHLLPAMVAGHRLLAGEHPAAGSSLCLRLARDIQFIAHGLPLIGHIHPDGVLSNLQHGIGDGNSGLGIRRRSGNAGLRHIVGDRSSKAFSLRREPLHRLSIHRQGRQTILLLHRDTDSHGCLFQNVDGLCALSVTVEFQTLHGNL